VDDSELTAVWARHGWIVRSEVFYKEMLPLMREANLKGRAEGLAQAADLLAKYRAEGTPRSFYEKLMSDSAAKALAEIVPPKPRGD